MDDLKKQIETFEAAIGGYKAIKADMDTYISGALAKIANLKRQIADSEATYSIGDRFKKPNEEMEWILTFADSAQAKVMFVSLSSGCWANGSHRVADNRDITIKEFAAMRFGNISRTYDARKQEKC